MALILAIESDRRQVSHLTAMVRGRLRAELVLGDTAEAALERLGDRVPDLVLTSPLLSPKDEQALSDRVRKLNGVASHVQTLTLPMFALPPSQTTPPRGVLSALLGDRSSDAVPNGCDPAVFAEQCREYLERSAVERDASKTAERDASTTAESGANRAVEWDARQVERDAPKEDPVSRSTVAEPARSLHISDNPASIIAALAAAEPETFDEQPIELAPVAEPLATAPDEENEEPAEARTAFDDVDLSDLLEEERPDLHATVDVSEDQPVYDLSDASGLDEPPAEAASDRDKAPASDNAHASDNAPANFGEDKDPADVGEKAPADFDEWQQVVDALKRESDRGRWPRRKSRGTMSPAPPSPAAAKPAAPGAPLAQRPRGAKRVHDEWGMFDPQEAGMAALFAKLEKLNSDDDDPPKSA